MTFRLLQYWHHYIFLCKIALRRTSGKFYKTSSQINGLWTTNHRKKSPDISICEQNNISWKYSRQNVVSLPHYHLQGMFIEGWEAKSTELLTFTTCPLNVKKENVHLVPLYLSIFGLRKSLRSHWYRPALWPPTSTKFPSN